jgi:hypothetical protein
MTRLEKYVPANLRVRGEGEIVVLQRPVIGSRVTAGNGTSMAAAGLGEDVTRVVIDFVLLKELDQLLFERLPGVVLSLELDVAIHGLEVRLAYGKRRVTGLPAEGG